MSKVSCKKGSNHKAVAVKEAVALVKLGQGALPGTPLSQNTQASGTSSRSG